RPHRDARRVVRGQRERAVHLPEEALVREPEMVVADALGERGELHEAGGRIVGKQQQARLHGSTSSDQIEVVYERSRYFAYRSSSSCLPFSASSRSYAARSVISMRSM